MLKIETFLPTDELEAFLENIGKEKVLNINFYQISSVSLVKGKNTQYRGVPSPSNFSDRIKIELIIQTEQLQPISKLIHQHLEPTCGIVVLEIKDYVFPSEQQNSL